MMPEQDQLAKQLNISPKLVNLISSELASAS
jgi:hypothetical protein